MPLARHQLLGLAMTGLGVAALALAAAARPATGASDAKAPLPAVRHGVEIDARRVGPAARGLAPIAGFAGGEIRDGRDYPFARLVPAGATYDGFAVAGPHLLVEQVAFSGPLDVYAALPLVLRGVSIRTVAAAPWGLHTRPGAGPLYFLWSEVGAASTEGAPDDASRALQRALYLRGDGALVYRSHLTHAADGIQIHGRGTRIVETLVDGLAHWRGDHNDGIQMLGRAADAVILRSRIVNPNPQTSALLLAGDRVRVEDNYLSGGGWTLYAGSGNGSGAGPAARGIVVTGNLFGREHFPKSGHFGPVTRWGAPPGSGNVWAGNRYADGPVVLPHAPSAGPATGSR